MIKLNEIPKVNLGHFPTPLQELPNLSRALNGPRIFVKRDDLTGLGFGGNKTRKLEYLLAEAVKNKADYLVTGASFQSNWCSQVAAAGRKLGMKVFLVKKGRTSGYDPEDYDGNHFLQFLMGAEINVVELMSEEKGYFVKALDKKIELEVMKKLKESGHRPYQLILGGSTPLGDFGYVNATFELISQSKERGIDIDYIVHATGSGGTQSGLVIGTKMFNTGIKVIGSGTGSRSKEEVIKDVSEMIDESLKFLKLDLKITKDDIIVYDQYGGGGYEFLSPQKVEAIRIVAETEGLFIDPVYTASSMSCLIDLCRKRFFKPSDVVVFLHTGGIAALFPYKTPLKDFFLGKTPHWTIPPWSSSSK
jgi:L-cysteate sulfo-lyase